MDQTEKKLSDRSTSSTPTGASTTSSDVHSKAKPGSPSSLTSGGEHTPDLPRSRSATGLPVVGQQQEQEANQLERQNSNGDAHEEQGGEDAGNQLPGGEGIVLQPDIVIEEGNQYSESEDDTAVNSSHSEGEDDHFDDEQEPRELPAAEVPLLRQEHGDDPQLKCNTLTLIPLCVLNHWRRCRAVYGVLLFVIVFILLATLVFIIFWAVEESKMRSRNITVSTHEVFNLSGLTSPNDHLFSGGLCIAAPDVPVFPIHDTYVWLIARPNCTSGKNRVTTTNSTLSIVGKLNSHAPVPYMLYLLQNSTIILSIHISNWKKIDKIKVFLLENKAVFDQCIYGHEPSRSAANKLCQHMYNTSQQDCKFSMPIEHSGHYYLCFWMPKCTVAGNYSIEIDPFWHYENIMYDFDQPECHHQVLAPKGKTNKTCCASYEDMFTEIWKRTCIFIKTNATDQNLGEYFELTILPQKRPVIWYSLGVLGLCTIIALILTIFCVATWRKVKNPDLPGFNCGIQLYPQEEDNRQPQQE